MAADPPPKGSRFPVLVSYAYLRKLPERRARPMLDCPWVDLMLDSGAFTAANSGGEVTLEEYCGYLRANAGCFWQYVALDRIGDPAATRRNLDAMVRAGLSPMPVHVLGDSAERMDELFSLSPRVCLGGLLRPGRGHADAGYLNHKMKWAAGRPVHWLGYVVPSAIQAHRPYSCDSSSWSYGCRYGDLHVYKGGGRMHVTKHKDYAVGQSVDPLVASALARLGYTILDLRQESSWRASAKVDTDRNIALNVNADSYVRYSLDVRRQFGTRLFLALSLANGEWAALLRRIVGNMGGRLTATEEKEADAVWK